MHKTTAAAAATLLAATTALAVPTAAHAATVVGPGTTILQKSADGKASTTCTVAFAGRSNGAKILLTAGHCNKDSAQVVTTDKGVPIGKYIASKAEDQTSLNSDASGYGVIKVNDDVDTTAVTSLGNLVGYRTAQPSDQVCIVGATSGRTCGQVVATDAKMATLTATVQGGDSGGPAITYLDGPRDSSGGYINYAIVGVVVGKHNKSTVINPITNYFAGVSADPAVGKSWTYTATESSTGQTAR